MQNATFLLRALGGHDAVEKLIAAAQKLFGGEVAQHFEIATTVTPSRIWSGEPIVQLRNNNEVQEILGLLKNHAFVSCTTVRIDVANEWRLAYSNGDGVTAQITLSYPDRGLSTAIGRITELCKHFSFTLRRTILDETVPQEIRDRITAVDHQVNVLTDQAARLQQIATDRIQDQDRIFNDKLKGLEEQHQKRQDALDQADKKRREEFESEVSAFREEKKQFDIRESKAVRRNLLKEIREAIKEKKRIELSPATVAKRRPVHGVFVPVLIIAASAVGAMAWHLAMKEKAPELHEVTMMVGFSVLFVSTLIWYVRWGMDWFRQHAEAEFRNMRFSDDILRASWLAELLFEWAEEHKDQPISDEVLVSLARNLFAEDKIRDTDHPLDTITKVFRRYDLIDIGQGALKMERAKK